MGEQHRDRARRHARAHRIGARGQNDRHPRAQHDPGGIGVGQERQLLGEHVARLEIGHQEYVGIARDLRADALDGRRLFADRVVERERPIEESTFDLPAFGHLAQRRRVDGRGDLGRDRLDRGQDRDLGPLAPERLRHVDGVLHDVDLGLEVGEDVDRGVGHRERLRVGRHIHDEHVADPALGAQAGVLPDHLGHQLVGVQAAFHQGFGLAGTDDLDRPRGGGVAVRHIDQAIWPDVQPELPGHVPYFGLRSDQDRPDQVGLSRLDRSRQRGLVARVRDRRGHRLKLGAGLDQLRIDTILARRLLRWRDLGRILVVLHAVPRAARDSVPVIAGTGPRAAING